MVLKVGGSDLLFGEGKPQATVTIKRPSLIPRLLVSPSLTFGEAYMRGDITVEGDLMVPLKVWHASDGVSPPKALQLVASILAKLPDSASKASAKAQHHYDIGNEFYKLWLDQSLTYSCAYFTTPEDTIDQAQDQKRALILKKLQIEPGQTLLDIGCGWGALMLQAAEEYGATVTGITPAKEQAAHVMAEAQRRGIADRVTVLNDDWRSLSGEYDRVVSVGMFEHVGASQYDQFMRRWKGLLKNGGVSLLHTIGHLAPGKQDAWVNKYIFPGGYLPALTELAESAERAGLSIIDQEDLWQHYALTLNRWYSAFKAKEAQVRQMFDEEFIRMWTLYLRGSEAGFVAGGLQLWQFMMVKDKRAPWPLDRATLRPSIVDR